MVRIPIQMLFIPPLQVFDLPYQVSTLRINNQLVPIKNSVGLAVDKLWISWVHFEENFVYLYWPFQGPTTHRRPFGRLFVLYGMWKTCGKLVEKSVGGGSAHERNFFVYL
jgi:hypothetical protein